MTCSLCAKEMPDDCKFCPQCGGRAQQTTPGGTAVLAAATPTPPSPTTPSKHRAPPSRRKGLSRPASSEAVHHLLLKANLYRLRRQWADAIDTCVAVLRLEPANHSAHSLLGDIYRDQGKGEEATQWYRMAVDLWPNAADEAKLKAQEEERARQLGRGEAHDGAAGKNRMLLMSPSGALVSGTTYLMGISPRRWLRTITAASLVFVALMLVVLVSSGSRHRPERTVTKIAPLSSTPPPPIRTYAPVGPPQPARRFTSAASASWPPNNSTLPRAYPPPLSPTPAASASLPTFRDRRLSITPDLAPASVLGIKPLQPRVSDQRAPATGARKPSLSGGMRIAQIVRDRGNGTVEIVITLPDNAVAGTMRSGVIRNIFRAARSEMEEDAAIDRASVWVRPESGAPDVCLAQASVDRRAALNADADGEPIGDLEQRMSSFEWFVQSPPPAPSEGRHDAPAATAPPS